MKTTRTAGLNRVALSFLALTMALTGCMQAEQVYGQHGHDGAADLTDSSDGDEGRDGSSGTRDGSSGAGDEGTTGIEDGTVLTPNDGGGDGPVVCGRPSVQALTAGQHIDIGGTTISNDADDLRVRFDTKDGWGLGTTHVHVGIDLNDVPKSDSGAPIPGQFDYSHPLDVNGGAAAVTTDTFVIPFSDLDLQSGACGMSLYVWAHAEAYFPGEGGTITQTETAWGGDTEGTGSKRWFFLTSYDLPCCD